jgi:hypothetical protein
MSRRTSAKGADACRQSAKKLARPLGGKLDTVPVLRVFLESTEVRRIMVYCSSLTCLHSEHRNAVTAPLKALPRVILLSSAFGMF